ncbi:MAG: hypothetical protein KBD56_05040 [Candidatus Eisenbacteria bacterium]|nr:hypothetical protein [Candidatus Eisenbacteria bacterium]
MRWLVLCTLALCLASSAWAVDTGSKYVMPVKDSVGDGAMDTREGGETYADALVIPGLPYSDTGATCDNRDDITPSCGYSVAMDVVYAYTPAEDVSVDVDLCGSGFDTIMEIQDGVGVPYVCNDDYCSTQSGFEALSLLAGHTYYIIVDAYSSNCGSYVLNMVAATPCDVVCPDGGFPEGEPDCYTGYVDNYNGGCNSYPYVFQPICPRPGETLVQCGKSGTYLSSAGGSYRDTDWFLAYGLGGTSVVTCQAEFPLQLILFYQIDPYCYNYAYYYTTAGRCEWATLSAYYAPQTPFWVWVGASQFNGVPCGSDYYFEVTNTWCQGVPTESENWGEIKNLFR